MKWPENCIIYVCVYNLSLADHSKLHAQISAQTACHLQPSQTRRYQSDWEFQDVHFHRNKIHGRHCISKSQSKCIIKFMICRFRTFRFRIKNSSSDKILPNCAKPPTPIPWLICELEPKMLCGSSIFLRKKSSQLLLLPR